MTNKAEERSHSPTAIPKLSNERFLIPGLDPLRALAALMVLVGHLEQFKWQTGLPNIYQMSFFQHTQGHTGVILFFVLSGFLITLLLLREREKTGAVSYKKFYLRRVLRIWPLYYLVLALSAWWTDYIPSTLTLVLCLTILPNIAHILDIGWKPNPPVWTIGVEEQFYLLWPAVISSIGKRLLTFLVVFVVAYTLIPHVLMNTLNRVPDPPRATIDFIGRFYYGVKFNCMAIGGIAAYFWHRGYRPAWLENAWLSNALLLVPFALWLAGFVMPVFGDEFYACLFGLLIYRVSTMTRLPAFFTNPVFVFLGKISYGIYMFHYVVLVAIVKELALVKFDSNLTMNIAVYASVIGVTVLIAALSFYTYERFFLSLKGRFNA